MDKTNTEEDGDQSENDDWARKYQEIARIVKDKQ